MIALRHPVYYFNWWTLIHRPTPHYGLRTLSWPMAKVLKFTSKSGMLSFWAYALVHQAPSTSAWIVALTDWTHLTRSPVRSPFILVQIHAFRFSMLYFHFLSYSSRFLLLIAKGCYLNYCRLPLFAIWFVLNPITHLNFRLIDLWSTTLQLAVRALFYSVQSVFDRNRVQFFMVQKFVAKHVLHRRPYISYLYHHCLKEKPVTFWRSHSLYIAFVHKNGKFLFCSMLISLGGIRDKLFIFSFERQSFVFPN